MGFDCQESGGKQCLASPRITVEPCLGHMGQHIIDETRNDASNVGVGLGDLESYPTIVGILLQVNGSMGSFPSYNRLPCR